MTPRTIVLFILLCPLLLPMELAGFVVGAAWRAWLYGWREARMFYPRLGAEDRLRRLVGDAVVFPDEEEKT